MMIQFKILELFQKGHFKISFTLKLSMLWTSLEGRNLDRPVLPSPLHPQKKRGECLFFQLAYLREVDATEFFLSILERIGLNWSRVGGGVDCSEIKLTLILCHIPLWQRSPCLGYRQFRPSRYWTHGLKVSFFAAHWRMLTVWKLKADCTIAGKVTHSKN